MGGTGQMTRDRYRSHYVCVNLSGVTPKTEPPRRFEYCSICRGWHDVRWHQVVWRRQAYEESRELVAVYRQEAVN
jgi:hypothetical protein